MPIVSVHELYTECLIGYCYTQLENKVFPVVMYGFESWIGYSVNQGLSLQHVEECLMKGIFTEV